LNVSVLQQKEFIFLEQQKIPVGKQNLNLGALIPTK